MKVEDQISPCFLGPYAPWVFRELYSYFCKQGDLECMQWLDKVAPLRTLGDPFDLFEEAAFRNHVDILEWLIVNNKQIYDDHWRNFKRHNDLKEWFGHVAGDGYLKVMQLIYKHFSYAFHFIDDSDDVVVALNDAAGNGHLPVVEWLVRTFVPTPTICPNYPHKCPAAREYSKTTYDHRCACYGCDWGVSRGKHGHTFRWNIDRAIDLATKNEHIELVQWLRENMVENKCGLVSLSVCNHTPAKPVYSQEEIREGYDQWLQSRKARKGYDGW